MWTDILWTCAMLASCLTTSMGQLCFLEYCYGSTYYTSHQHLSDEEVEVLIDDTPIETNNSTNDTIVEFIPHQPTLEFGEVDGFALV